MKKIASLKLEHLKKETAKDARKYETFFSTDEHALL